MLKQKKEKKNVPIATYFSYSFPWAQLLQKNSNVGLAQLSPACCMTTEGMATLTTLAYQEITMTTILVGCSTS